MIRDIRFRATADGVHEVTFRGRQAFNELLTCKAEKANPIIQYELLSYNAPVLMSV